jgi:putative ABC transport system permease protein
VPADKSEEKVIALLKERHKIAPNDTKAIGHWNMAVEFNKLSGLFNGIEILVWIVGIGTLMAGVIGISNIMLIVVKERTKEIGVKRALGAVPAQIIGQIVLEAIFLTSISGYFGLVIGIGLLEGLNAAIGDSGEMFTNPTVDLNVALQALGILILSGAFAGLIPASKAVAIKPVEALRTE